MVINIITTFCLSSDPVVAFENMIVPEGFSKQLIAVEPDIMDPVAFCFDDDGNILVAESFRQEKGVEDNRSSPFWLTWDLALQTVPDRLEMYKYFADQRETGMEYYSEYEDRIRKLIDVDGDGVFETAEIFADGFSEPLDGTGSGVLAMDGMVWYACIPHLWFFDTDGQRQSMFGEVFGVRIALRGHDMHGLALGLDGRLYWSIGDRGYHVEFEDGTELHSPGEGAVFRSELDGEGLEVFHHGLRNPQELAFDNYGNLFTGDNNSDSVDKARLVYCVEGGETGWRMEYQTLAGENDRGPWVKEEGWDPHAENRPAWILPAVDTLGSGPSGFVAYPGLGLSERYDNHFFLCDFRGGADYSNVISFAVEPKGASFTLEDEHVFVDKVLCTDVDFSYEGKMVISDWGQGWMGNEEGRLYSVWDEANQESGDVSSLFRNGFKNLSVKALITLLEHKDRRVRIRAQYEVAARKSTDEIVAALNSHHQLGRIHAMWALAMIDRKGLVSQMHHIVPLLQDADAEVRAQACRILGEANYSPAFEQVSKLINGDTSRVSFFSTIASGHLGDALDEVLEMLDNNNDDDVYLRHAGVVALANSQYPSMLVNLQTHSSASVRLAAVLALRKQSSPYLMEFLQDPDDDVATEAARAIHDARIANGAMNALAMTLNTARTIPWQRRALSANKMEHTCAASVRVAQFASDLNSPESLRILAMQSLRDWTPRPEGNRDIVEGRIIPQSHLNAVCVGEVDAEIGQILETATGELLIETMQFVFENEIQILGDYAQQWLHDESLKPDVRAYALHQDPNNKNLEYALSTNIWQLRVAAFECILKEDPHSVAPLLYKAIEEGELQEAQAAVTLLGKTTWGLEEVDIASLPIELHLEYAQATGKPLMFGDPLEEPWLIYGGDIRLGKQIVCENTRSECLRCHKISGRGGIAGPSLDGIADRLSDRELLDSLLVPNKSIAAEFGEYSSMPPMGVLLNHRELRDVVAYLKSLHQKVEE